jgi:hypothetical protein
LVAHLREVVRAGPIIGTDDTTVTLVVKDTPPPLDPNDPKAAMSLVSSAARNDLDVFMYVKDVLDRLLAGETNYETLRPDDWKQSHPETLRIYHQEERQSPADAKAVKPARRRIARKG